MTPRLVLLVATAQLADLAAFGLAVRVQGIGGELGPLATVYGVGDLLLHKKGKKGKLL